MLIKISGVVLKSWKINFEKKIIWILTEKYGVIKAFVKEHDSKISFMATEILCFSNFVLFQSKNSFTVNYAEVKEPFINIRNNIENLALASYFCQIILVSIPQQLSDFSSAVKLVYISLSVLNSSFKNLLQIKAIFELKISAILGFEPKLEENQNSNIFSIITGSFTEKPDYYSIKLNAGVISAIRYILNSPLKKIFSFKLSEHNLKQLALVSEKYLAEKIELHLSTLDYFWKIYNADLQMKS